MELNGRKPIIAVVGATGLVGSTFRKVLEERKFPYEKAYMFASERSAGKTITFDGADYEVQLLDENAFDGKNIDIALFSAGGATSEKFAPIAAAAGAVVVDNSSQWRMDPEVPLLVPEVNPSDAFTAYAKKNIISNPNCSTIQAVVPLKALQDKYGLKRVIYSTYQAVAGTGMKGIKDLEEGLKGNDLLIAYPHPIANNCIPQIDSFLENGYTKEEMKMVEETRKILHDDSIGVTATTVRVPVFVSHSESVNVEFEKPFGDIKEVQDVLAAMPGVVLKDDPANSVYPLAREAADTDEIYVGRIRRDFSVESGINFWCVADNVRKGAATNAVQIAELLVKGN